MNSAMRTVILHGQLGAEFGTTFRFHVVTPAEALRALCTQLKGFKKALAKGNWHVVRVSRKTKMLLDGPELITGMGKAYELHVVPVPEGAKSGMGIGKIIAGVVLIAATVVTMGAAGAAVGASAAAAGSSVAAEAAVAGAVGLGSTAFSVFGTAITFGQLLGFGAMLAIGGVATLFGPKIKAPKYNQRQAAEDRASFLFNGAVNVNVEGATKPVVYGEYITGSIVASAGIQNEVIPV